MSDNLIGVKAFLDDTRVIGKRTCKNHIQTLDQLLATIEDEGFQINIANRKWATNAAEFLRYAVKKKGLH